MFSRISACLLVFLGAGAMPPGQSKSESETYRLHIEEYGLYNALRDIAQTTHHVIGLAQDTTYPLRDNTYKLDIEKGTLENALDLVVSQAPSYAWHKEPDGSIRVFQKSAGTDRLDAVRLSFKGASRTTRQQIWLSLKDVPEINAWLTKANCIREDILSGREWTSHNDPINLVPLNESVGDLFDKVASDSGTYYWAVIKAQSGSACRVSILLW
jgi:hypothetical protein